MSQLSRGLSSRFSLLPFLSVLPLTRPLWPVVRPRVRQTVLRFNADDGYVADADGTLSNAPWQLPWLAVALAVAMRRMPPTSY